MRPHAKSLILSNSSISLLGTALAVLKGQGASVDISRILRDNYVIKPYTRLVTDECGGGGLRDESMHLAHRNSGSFL
jgi:hypothetical protein